MDINNKIKALRENANMTQSELGEKLEVSEKVVSKWENGDTKPGIELLPKIADVFGINIDDMFEHRHDNSSDIKNTVYNYLHDTPCENALDTMQKLISYMILGADVRYNEEGGWYAPDVMEELKEEWRGYIESRDERTQIYCPDYKQDCTGSIRNIDNNELKFTVLQNYPDNTFLNILSEYELYSKIFKFLAMPSADKILRYYYSGEIPENYTIDYAVEKSGAPAETVIEYLKLTGIFNYSDKAIIDGNVVNLYKRAINNFGMELQTVIGAAFGIFQDRRGNR